jgi:hypothetical protein
MSCTKKDFIRMAEYLRFYHAETDEKALHVGFVAGMLHSLYPNFDSDKFLRACQKRELK